MERRLIVAMVLSMVIVTAWYGFFPPPKPPARENLQSSAQAPLAQKTTPAMTPSLAQEPAPSSLANILVGNVEFVFVEPQAAIKDIIFKEYQSYRWNLKSGLLLDGENLVFTKTKLTPEETRFVYEDTEKQIIKRFIMSKSNYTIDLELELKNLSTGSIVLNPLLTLGTLNFVVDPQEAAYLGVTVATPEKTVQLNARKEMRFESVQFVGLRNRYFCAIIEPEIKNNYAAQVRKINSTESAVDLILKETTLAPGQTVVQKFRIYLGPQDLRLINSINPSWSAVINYGMFDFIAQIFLQALQFFYGIVHSWGWAIVILSIAIYLLLFPLSLKQMRSMKEMQALKPHLEELRKLYKDNPQRFQKEQIELFRKHKVNPFGGCLPLLLQMPVFLALLQVLQRSVLLKGAKFLWIKDLSKPDQLYKLPVSIPILGNYINILPILMAIIMVVQQKLTMATSGAETPENQKLMVIMMPLIFGIAFYNMPAGLVLYWFINSTLMFLYQLKISRQK